MFFSLSAPAFKRAVSNAKLAIPSGQHRTLPVLASILFEVAPDGGSVSITSTDLDVMLVQTLPLEEPGGPGSALFPFAMIASIHPDPDTLVRLSAAGELAAHFPIHGQPAGEEPGLALYVSSGHSARIQLPILSRAEFPDWTTPPPPEDYTILLTSVTMDAITASRAFQSQDPTRYVLNGVYLGPERGGTIAASDGRALARWKGKATPVACIVPSKACAILSRLKISCAAAALHASEHPQDPTAISFRAGEVTLHSRLVIGKYPNYEQCIPESATSGITFADPIGIATWLAGIPEGKKTQTSVRLAPKPPHFVDISHPGGSITATAYLQGSPPDITFNPALLSKCLSAVPGTLHLTDSTSPGVLRKGNALVVLMPMRTQDTPSTSNCGEEATADSAE
jgi:DNA polymerase III sliding clamp (beta) subunit (PCNA family)